MGFKVRDEIMVEPVINMVGVVCMNVIPNVPVARSLQPS